MCNEVYRDLKGPTSRVAATSISDVPWHSLRSDGSVPGHHHHLVAYVMFAPACWHPEDLEMKALQAALINTYAGVTV